MTDYAQYLHYDEPTREGDSARAHHQRYQVSAQWLEPLMGQIACLECGGTSPFTRLIAEAWPQVGLTSMGDADLREPWPYASETFDLVLLMEVIEHIKDRPEDPREIFTGGGIRHALAEAYRVLKPGGRLFVSTPNLACWHSIHRLVAGYHPFFFEKHHRELTWNDVSGYLAEAGFTVERCETIDVWNQHGTDPRRIHNLRVALAGLGCPEESRGDCLFCLAGKHPCR